MLCLLNEIEKYPPGPTRLHVTGGPFKRDQRLAYIGTTYQFACWNRFGRHGDVKFFVRDVGRVRVIPKENLTSLEGEFNYIVRIVWLS